MKSWNLIYGPRLRPLGPRLRSLGPRLRSQNNYRIWWKPLIHQPGNQWDTDSTAHTGNKALTVVDNRGGAGPSDSHDISSLISNMTWHRFYLSLLVGATSAAYSCDTWQPMVVWSCLQVVHVSVCFMWYFTCSYSNCCWFTVLITHTRLYKTITDIIPRLFDMIFTLFV